jgi:glutaminyl-tRNA synthetase
VEPFVAESAKVGMPLQFQRIGYFTLDPDSDSSHMIFNRTMQLKDTWEKIQKK